MSSPNVTNHLEALYERCVQRFRRDKVTEMDKDVTINYPNIIRELGGVETENAFVYHYR